MERVVRLNQQSHPQYVSEVLEVRQNSRRFDFVDQRQTSENVGLSIFSGNISRQR